MIQDHGASAEADRAGGLRPEPAPQSQPKALIPSREERPWPLGTYAPGNYFVTCVSCGSQFQGDKRALVCLECAVRDAKFLLASAIAKERAWRAWFDSRNTALDELVHAASVFWGMGSEQHNLVRDVAAAVLKDYPRDSDAGSAGDRNGLHSEGAAARAGTASPSPDVIIPVSEDGR